ncbi:MAG TPA: type IV pilin [Candidatus Thermoplasmatota archaeon]|nr:type IV pilin [Candidatus Thermoplasmatota archaeon]
MKANQAFKNDSEAVSPVIGVILMVAITVVLAAVVFVLVSNLSKGGSQSAPTLAINTDDVADRLVVTSAATGADWSRISVKLVSCTQATASSRIYVGSATANFNQDAVTAGGSLNAGAAGTACAGTFTAVQVTTTATAILAGGFLDFCTGPPGATPATTVVVSLTDTVANSQIGQYTFTSVQACAT